MEKKLNNLILNGSKSERKIAKYMLSEYPFSATGNLNKIAKISNSSISTVQRMIVKLGFSGFPEFRAYIFDLILKEQANSPYLRMDGIKEDNIENKHYKNSINNIKSTFLINDEKILKETAYMLCDSKQKIWCVGGRFTGLLATLFARHLKTIRLKVREFTPYEGALADIYNDSDKLTIFITDIRRYDQPLLNLATKAKIAGAKIILATDIWGSPIKKVADITLSCYTDDKDSRGACWDSNVAMLCLLEELMAESTKILGDDAKKMLKKRELFLYSNAIDD